MAIAGAAPVGADPNYAKVIRGVLSSELGVSVIIVGLRCFTRVKLTRSPGLDDCLMVAALARLPCSAETPFQLHSIMSASERHPVGRCNSCHRVIACIESIR